MKKMIWWTVVIALGVAAPPAPAQAQGRTLDERVTLLEQRIGRMDTVLGLGVVSAVICAWWAQNTGRHAVLWFFAGLIFSVISLLVLLSKNAADLRARRTARPPPGA